MLSFLLEPARSVMVRPLMLALLQAVVLGTIGLSEAAPPFTTTIPQDNATSLRPLDFGFPYLAKGFGLRDRPSADNPRAKAIPDSRKPRPPQTTGNQDAPSTSDQETVTLILGPGSLEGPQNQDGPRNQDSIPNQDETSSSGRVPVIPILDPNSLSSPPADYLFAEPRCTSHAECIVADLGTRCCQSYGHRLTEDGTTSLLCDERGKTFCAGPSTRGCRGRMGVAAVSGCDSFCATYDAEGLADCCNENANVLACGGCDSDGTAYCNVKI